MNNSTAADAVRTRTGTKVHKAYTGGSSTHCGLRVKRLVIVDIAKVDPSSRCEKCF